MEDEILVKWYQYFTRIMIFYKKFSFGVLSPKVLPKTVLGRWVLGFGVLSQNRHVYTESTLKKSHQVTIWLNVQKGAKNQGSGIFSFKKPPVGSFGLKWHNLSYHQGTFLFSKNWHFFQASIIIYLEIRKK